MTTTAVVALQSAVYDTLVADLTLRAALGWTAEEPRVHAARAPQGLEPPYVVLGAATEGGAHSYGTEGHAGTLRLHCWGAHVLQARQLYAHVARILGEQPLPLTGHTLVRGIVEYVTDQRDDTTTAHQVVARVRTRTVAAA